VRLPAGFIGAVAMPDLLIGPGMAAKGVKAAKRFYDVRKIAPRVLELLTDVAEARKTKDMAKAKKAEVALRDYTPQVADMLDRYDAAAARRFQMVDPIDEDIFNENVSALLATLDDEGAKALAAERVHLHPSMRKPETAAKLPTKEETYSSFDELFNTDILEARVSKAKADYIATAPRTVQEHFSRYAKGLTRSKLEAYKKAKVITQAELDDLARIVEASTAPALAGNMGQWKSALQATLKAHPVFGDPKLAPLRKAVYVNVGKSLESRAHRCHHLLPRPHRLGIVHAHPTKTAGREACGRDLMAHLAHKGRGQGRGCCVSTGAAGVTHCRHEAARPRRG
jgi:hypothetical protein